MSGRATEAGVVAVLATLVTVVLAAAVLRAPSERIFGRELVGRHYDPFTVMEHFSRPVRWNAFLQPLTDLPGAVLARQIGAVASYNALVLLSFPLTAVAAYGLARHCALSRAGAAAASLAVAFSPFHLAHAAYHPHIAQLQWLPWYLLALWRCLDRPARAAAALLACAVVGVTLSNFYGGLIAAAITPVTMAAYWHFRMRQEPRATRRLLLTAAALVVMAIAGASYAVSVAGDLFSGAAPPVVASRDLSKYAATWWSYLVPPASHPWMTSWGEGQAWRSHPALLERQLSLGWGLLALSGVAVAAWLRRRATVAALSIVPVLVAIAVFALLCSLAPAATWLHAALPMFRSYARFGGAVQLMVALLAAIGAERLWQSRQRWQRVAAAGLVGLALVEYAVWPTQLSRDVLPTRAHRWVAQHPPSTRALDCFPYTLESQSVQWLTAGRVILRAASFGDCREPGVIAALSALGYTHLLVRRQTPEGQWFAEREPPAGLRLAGEFGDARVFAITARASVIRTVRSEAFYPVEFNDEWAWRWMGPQASWTVVNDSARYLMATVDLEINAFHEARPLSVVLDGEEVQRVVIEPRRAVRRLGPLALRPGPHTVVFRTGSAPTVADERLRNGDRRPLSLAFGDWRWSIDGDPR